MSSQRKEKWEKETLEPALKRFPERQKNFKLTSGMDIKPLYTPDDLSGFDVEEETGYPGEYPFGRGIQPTMYRGRLWTMRQYSGFASAEESNRRYLYLLQQGQTGLSLAFDLPTQIGYDSDSPSARGEVGKVGVPIDTLRDMEVLFKDIPLDKVSTSMTINATAPILLAMYIALAEKQGISPDKLDGTIQNDILKEYIARGTYIFPPAVDAPDHGYFRILQQRSPAGTPSASAATISAKRAPRRSRKWLLPWRTALLMSAPRWIRRIER